METIVPVEAVEKKIYMIRGQKVMLDRDLAELYGVETRVLNQAVRRNIERFPEDFLIKLTRDEIRDISQIVICPGIKHAPNVFAFTGQGIAMLSSVLKSDRAIQVNIAVMRAFVKLREVLSTHKELAHKLAELEGKIERHDDEIKAVFDAIRGLMMQPAPKKRKMGF